MKADIQLEIKREKAIMKMQLRELDEEIYKLEKKRMEQLEKINREYQNARAKIMDEKNKLYEKIY